MRMALTEQEMSSYVTVFSNIPKLAACLKNAMPNIHFHEVSPGTTDLHSQFNRPAKGKYTIGKEVMDENGYLLYDTFSPGRGIDLWKLGSINN